MYVFIYMYILSVVYNLGVLAHFGSKNQTRKLKCSNIPNKYIIHKNN